MSTMPDANAHPEDLAGELQRLIAAVDAGGRMLLPSTAQAMLESILDACVSLFNAAGASILLADEAAQELVFKAARSAGDVDVVGLRIAATSGIAGYVYMTGQPIAVSDVQRDARFNQSFARSVGYLPQSILATPLMRQDHVIGVMEVLDKRGASAFDMRDMELLGLMARQAALAIRQMVQVEDMNAALLAGIRALLNEASPAIESVLQRDQSHEAAENAADLKLFVELFQQIAVLGNPERKLAIRMMDVVAEYAREKAGPFAWRGL